MIEVNTRPTGTRLGQSGFASLTNVSRETSERLGQYVSLLIRWNARINLVGANTLGDVWRRHILDSAQLLPLLPANTQTLIDLGSGAGLPRSGPSLRRSVPISPSKSRSTAAMPAISSANPSRLRRFAATRI